MVQLRWNTKVRVKQVEPWKGETQNYHVTQQFHSWQILERNKNIHPDKHVYTNAPNGIIHNINIKCSSTTNR